MIIVVLLRGFQVFENHVDVVVCDGFVGNILLKTSDLSFFYFKIVSQGRINEDTFEKVRSATLKGAFLSMKKELNPDQLAGAPLLGLNGLVIKTHGSSDRYAIQGAIRVTSELIEICKNLYKMMLNK